MTKRAGLVVKLGEIVITVLVEPKPDRTVFSCKRCGVDVHTSYKASPEPPASVMRTLLVHELRCYEGKG